MAGRPRAPIYVIDSSSWISIEGHPAQNRILWHVGKLIEEGRAICPPEAHAEVKTVSQVLAWLDQYEGKQVRAISDADYLLRVGQVAFRFPQMAGVRGGKEKADQYIVAMALHLTEKTSAQHVAVSEETSARRPSRKLSTACAVLGVPHRNLIGMLRDEFPDEDF